MRRMPMSRRPSRVGERNSHASNVIARAMWSARRLLMHCAPDALPSNRCLLHRAQTIAMHREQALLSLLPTARPTVVWTTLSDGAVLFSTETEVYYSVNGVGALIWELLPNESMTLDALCDAVHDRFPDATRAQIGTDVVELLTDLERCGLVDSPS